MFIIHSALLLNDFSNNSNFLDKDNLYFLLLSSVFMSRAAGFYAITKLYDVVKSAFVKYIIYFSQACSYLIFLSFLWASRRQILLDKYCFIALYLLVTIHFFFSISDGLGARLYLVENTKTSQRYSAVGIIDFSARVGNLVALSLLAFAIKMQLDYSTLLLVMFIVAVFIAVIRMKLRDARVLIDAKRRVKKIISSVGDKYSQILENNIIWKYESNIFRNISLICIELGIGGTFFFTYIYLSFIAKNSFGLPIESILLNNFYVAIIEILGGGIAVLLSRFILPMKIFKLKLIIFIIFSLFLYKILALMQDARHIFSLQCFYSLLLLSPISAYPALYKYFSIFKRFRYTTLMFALSKGLVFLFGVICILLHDYIGYYAATIFMLTIAVFCAFGFLYFDQLDKNDSGYPDTNRWGI